MPSSPSTPTPPPPPPLDWQALPRPVSELLLRGSVGEAQLFSVADAALDPLDDKNCALAPEMQATLLTLAQGAMLAAWEGDPLNVPCARHVLQLHEAFPYLDPALAAWGKIVRATKPYADAQAFNTLLLQGDTTALQRFLQRTRRKEPRNLLLVRQGILAAFMQEDLDFAQQWINESEALTKGVRTGISGDICFARGQWRSARQCYTAALRDMPCLLWRERLGEAALREGDVDACLDAWDTVLAARPWHTNLALRRHDIAHGLHQPGELPPGKGVILLYTFNKRDFIDTTLASLMDSDTGQTPVLVLNNGSTDGTVECLRGWEERSGGRIRGVYLPCNVGAPAARNWLLTEPECRAADWLAYLDDDVHLPADWLRLLGRAMDIYPGHAVYGCRVVNHDTPMTLQSVDLHLEPGETREDLQDRDCTLEPVFARRFAVSGIHHQTPDFGDFTYVRPCASVTGCCHLFRRESIDAVGEFDVRFSPSQYDDLEHDIRHLLHGQWPIYQGHLRVRHMKRTGRAAMQDKAQLLAAWGNAFKLQVKYTPEQFAELREREYAILLEDMRRRMPG